MLRETIPVEYLALDASGNELRVDVTVIDVIDDIAPEGHHSEYYCRARSNG